MIKQSMIFLLMILGQGSWAKPLCSSADVKLSWIKPDCQSDRGKIFDIPELELDMDELKKILEGAESIGGRPVNPQNTISVFSTNRVRPYRYSCSVDLLADGGKTVSWLSSASFKLTHTRAVRFGSNLDWRHGLIPGNDMTAVPVKVPMSPNINLGDYEISILPRQEGPSRIDDDLRLTVCKVYESRSKKYIEGQCAESVTVKARSLMKVRLMTYEIDRTEGLHNKYTLEVSCL